MNLEEKLVPRDEVDERKFKNLATRVMSNGVEVLVKDKSGDNKSEQRKLNFMHILSSPKPTNNHAGSSLASKQSLLSSAVSTVINQQQMSALFPLHHFMQHNYIIKTCMTTFTYLTTLIQNKRTAVSTFETTVSVVTTESLTKLFGSDIIADVKPTKTKYMETKTIQPTAPINIFQSDAPKINKRIDQENEEINSFDVIQPSEVGHVPCTVSCSCSQSKTEGLNAKYTNNPSVSTGKYEKTSNYAGTKVELKPTNKQNADEKTHYSPYEYEIDTQLPPSDKIVQKYTEVINDYSNEKESSVEESELLTNEEAAPSNQINNKVSKTPGKTKPEKPLKPNKNKFVVADLMKLGSLGIKGLSQLAPVIEKITGGFIRRQEINKTTTTTVKPVTKLTSYNMEKRVDSELEAKHSNFPIYIPMNEMETSESNIVLTNATLHQNLAWVADRKQLKPHIVPPRIVHESPLVNGGIPISPGEIITTNSDVIVGKPAVGRPLTLSASGMKLHNVVNPPPLDSYVSGSEPYLAKEIPPMSDQALLGTAIDDSFDLKPPELPKVQAKPNRQSVLKPFGQHIPTVPNRSSYRPSTLHSVKESLMKTEQIKATGSIIGNHGRPAFLDYIPSLGKPNNIGPGRIQNDFKTQKDENRNKEVLDNSPSSSEVMNTHIKPKDGDLSLSSISESINKPFLVDIQPSRVANVLIPHGSTTAIVFAGSSEPHKTGDYIDDPLPYPEPGYFGSFSIDAPQMTNVHSVTPENNNQYKSKPNLTTPPLQDQSFRKEYKLKWKDSKTPEDFSQLPPPTSNQETYLHVGPQITSYDPDIYRPSNGEFVKYNTVRNKDKNKEGKDVIDKEYENYLSVPPPPPKMHSQENRYDKNKPYNQRPVVHTKPIQDMKVFLNIQHPIPKDQLPPKVTSEIYFAAQTPHNKQTPTYTIHIPPSSSVYGDNFKPNIYNQPHHVKSENIGNTHNSFSIIPSPNFLNKPISSNNVNENSYSVTLNTATNVASNHGNTAQVIGTSIPVSIGASPGQKYNANNFNQNTDIPIGTNFAIRVEDDTSPAEDFDVKGVRKTYVGYDDHNHIPFEVNLADNRWNKSSVGKTEQVVHDKNNSNQKIDNNDKKDDKIIDKYTERPLIGPSINSHANFPMINEYSFNENIKPVTKNIHNETQPIDKRPPKVMSNVLTNSHGWYSNFTIANINNINVEATTRKIIPLNYDLNKHNITNFGQKVIDVGKPPTDFWTQNPSAVLTHIGKPFSKPNENDKHFLNNQQLTVKPHILNYFPPNFSGVKQPVYNIPVRDDSGEITTVKSTKDTEDIKLVYEDYKEIYDGNEGSESEEPDSAISLESMKVPVVSASNEKEVTKSSTELTLLQYEVFDSSDNKRKDVKSEDYNPGTQTEKPFGSFNKTGTSFTNIVKPIYGIKPNVKPRPFAVNTVTPIEHQLHQPHWQINQLMENVTNMSYEDNMELNIGEYLKPTTTKKPTQKTTSHFVIPDFNYRKPQRPVFSLRPNSSLVNESNIITSTVHIKDKKPLIVDVTENSALPSFTIKNDEELNLSSSEIINLSPPPPTMDYNFKPSTKDEMIMGMSPPPMTPSLIKIPSRTTSSRPIYPIRTPPPYRTKPLRTLPPRIPTQKPTRKPLNRDDDVSTYRPAFDVNKIKRPNYNIDQISSQLLPPPEETPSRVITPLIDIPSPTVTAPPVSNVVFPTPTSSGWSTSSGIEFSSSFNFDPTPIYYPETAKSSSTPQPSDKSSTENIYSYEESTENSGSVSFDKPKSTEKITSYEITEVTESTLKVSDSSEETNSSDSSLINDFSQEESSTEGIKIIPLSDKNRTRKPYPVRNDEKKSSTNKYKQNSKPTTVIRPTRTRPGVLYPTHTRHVSTNKIIKPLPTKSYTITASVIDGSESSIHDEYIKPTEVLKENVSTLLPSETTSLIEKMPSSIVTPSLEDLTIKTTHHSGNEVKIFDEIIPTKTEFKTTVVTLTKTLSEPPMTVSSIGFLNMTHTLTVTHTMTSLISKSEGAVTQTLVLTNTHTSTIVDVVTEVRTQVQPTTIIETVTKHIPVPQVEPTPVQVITTKTKVALDDVTMSSEESDNYIIKDNENIIQKIVTENETDNDTFFVVMNKSQNGGQSPPVNGDIDTGDYDITRNEQVNNNGVSQVLFGEILLAGAPYLETTNVAHGVNYGKECLPDCKASRNERCQRIDGIMKCVCRPGFARMFSDRPCKPTYTYSVELALGSQGNENLQFDSRLSDNSSKEYHALAQAAHEGINRMVMQSDLRDVYHGVHIKGFHPVEIKKHNGDVYQGVMNDFYVQLSDNAHESRLKEVIEKYLRNNNYSLGGTDVHAASELMDRLDVNDFDECLSGQFHDCSEHAQCFNLRGTYTCSCLEGYADLSVNTLYPGRICSAEPVGCERCNYHGACYTRDDRRILCECFQWYSGSSCQINLKVVLISLVVLGALLTIVLAVCAVIACSRKRTRPPPRSIVACIQSMPGLQQGAMPSKQRADRRALINERADSGDASSVQNVSLPYMPAKRPSTSNGKKLVISDPPTHEAPPPPPAVMIPRARLHQIHDSRENIDRKRSIEISSEEKLISYLESGATKVNDEMRRKHSLESSYSAHMDRHNNKQGALVSAGFKVSTTVRPDEPTQKEDRDDLSSVHKAELEAELERFDSLRRKSYSQEDLSEWTDAERRLGEHTLSEARSVGGTLPASTGRAASSTRLTHQDANTMAERDLGSTFLLPHVHLYKPDLTSDVSEFDSL